MADQLRTISPIDGSVYVERNLASWQEVEAGLKAARIEQPAWKRVSVTTRADILTRFVEAFLAMTDEMEPELSWQTGLPVSQAEKEFDEFEECARYMIDVAASALGDMPVAPKDGINRFISRDALGIILVVAPWDHPYLAAINVVIPALMAGNAVILKHSAQTPLCAERFAAAFEMTEFPADVFQYFHMDHDVVARVIRDPRINYVAFNGSVRGGRAMQEAARERFIGMDLELAGNHPAYVWVDADLDFAVERLIEGCFGNGGQSSSAVERVYVDGDLHDRFVEEFAAKANEICLGDPLNPATNIGPVINSAAAKRVRHQVADAVGKGATAMTDSSRFPLDVPDSLYVAPHVLSDTNHSMPLMIDETFGPAIGIMKVTSDSEAIRLMNNARYGISASVWTRDEEAAVRIGRQIETGTWFMNRCDYIDPQLSCGGVTDSAPGRTLSGIRYEYLTRSKSFYLRKPS